MKTLYYSDLRLGTNDKIDELSRDILLFYIQNNWDTKKQRLMTILPAAEWIGFKYISVIRPKGKRECVFKYPKKEKLFPEFIKEIRGIKRWSWEGEQIQIANILIKYKNLKKKWYQFWI